MVGLRVGLDGLFFGGGEEEEGREATVYLSRLFRVEVFGLLETTSNFDPI